MKPSPQVLVLLSGIIALLTTTIAVAQPPLTPLNLARLQEITVDNLDQVKPLARLGSG